MTRLFSLCLLYVLAVVCTATECSQHDAPERDSFKSFPEVSLLQAQVVVSDELRAADSAKSTKSKLHLDASLDAMSMVMSWAARHGISERMLAGLVIFVLLALVGGSVAVDRLVESAPEAEATVPVDSKKEKADGPSPNLPGQQANNNGSIAQPAIKTVLFYIIGHSLSASTLTVVNKWAMNTFHPPGVAAGDNHHGYVWTLSLIQFIFSFVVAKLIGVIGLDKCEAMTWKRGLAYFPAAGMFMISIVAGNAVMNYSSVSTFLVMRALVPVPCAFLEMVIYKDPVPPALSWLGLGVLVAGTVVYGMSLESFEMNAVGWVVIFMVCMPIDGLLIKHAISASSLSSWGLVYYNNLLATLPLLFYVYVFEVPSAHALSELLTALMVPEAAVAVLASCVVGLSISYFQMTTRYYISATAFMILGVVNKFLTVIWTELFMNEESSYSLTGVLLALSGAVAWQLSMSTMGGGSVKVREKSETSQSGMVLAFGSTVAALAAAAYVQATTV